ncbi:MAG: glycosyltransferase family 4 protein [Candidatus Marsarchaeota archaeon]|nr:glycosyltransferase family 4 protein [Candidatus Marsarchaeota archaeon]
MLESGSFKNIGGAAKDTYKLYKRLSKWYEIDLFGDFSKIDKNIETVSKMEFLHRKYDIIMLNSIRDVLFVNRYRHIHRKGNARFVYVDRGGVLTNLSSAGARKLLPKTILRSSLISSMKKWLDYYVAISPLQEKLAKKYFDENIKIKCIPIAPHDEFKVMKIGKNYTGALCVGRLDERQKRLSFMIRGIARVIEQHEELEGEELLRIVGEGRDLERYKVLVDGLGLGANIRFLGFLTGNKLVEAYNNAGFLVSSSVWESFGRNFIEAMACGLPLLINDRINVEISSKPKRSMVKGGYNGLVYRCDDISDFAEKFFRLYSNDKERSRFGSNALSYSKNFSFGKVIGSYKKIFDSL